MEGWKVQVKFNFFCVLLPLYQSLQITKFFSGVLAFLRTIKSPVSYKIVALFAKTMFLIKSMLLFIIYGRVPCSGNPSLIRNISKLCKRFLDSWGSWQNLKSVYLSSDGKHRNLKDLFSIPL